jgi:hypothetical protein
MQRDFFRENKNDPVKTGAYCMKKYRLFACIAAAIS